MVEQETRPLVVCDATGTPVDVVRQNAKGHAKSIESGELWSLHPESGRLLPYPGGDGAVVEDRGSWYRAQLSQAEEPAGLHSGAGATATGASPGRPRGGETAGAGPIDAVLADLALLIRERHAEMPQGSYTTHLFASGSDKIRKKVGEEAVEILLAHGGELVNETADLLYHLLVLLEAEGVTLDQVAAELRKR